jgi:hypothetical protein
MIQTSDSRDKKDVTDLDDGLEAILQLRPVQYRWKKSPDQSMHIGLLAQEVQNILPEVVRSTNFVSDEEGVISEVNTERLGMNYATLTPVVIKAIQEQQQMIIEQQMALDQQALVIQDLLTRLNILEDALIRQPGSNDKQD